MLWHALRNGTYLNSVSIRELFSLCLNGASGRVLYTTEGVGLAHREALCVPHASCARHASLGTETVPGIVGHPCVCEAGLCE